MERKLSQLDESTSAALLASDLSAYLWLEVHMAICDTENIVSSSGLQRELKKKKNEQLENAMNGAGGEVSTPGEQGEAAAQAVAAQAAADSLEVPVRDMISYLIFHRDVTDEYFKQLVGQLKPWGGTSVCVPPV